MIPDISEFQHLVNWNAVGAAYRQGSIEGVIIRSSIGTKRADAYFSQNRAGAREQKIPHLFYHFCYPSVNSPLSEAAFFNAVVGPLQEGEGQAGDFENDGPYLWPANGLAWASTFLTGLRAPQSASAWYTTVGFARGHNLLSLQNNWNGWQAEYGVSRPAPGMNPALWQFTDCATVPGIPGCCDASVLMRGAFRDLTIGAPAAPHHREIDMVILQDETGAQWLFSGVGEPWHIGPVVSAGLTGAGVPVVPARKADIPGAWSGGSPGVIFDEPVSGAQYVADPVWRHIRGLESAALVAAGYRIVQVDQATINEVLGTPGG